MNETPLYAVLEDGVWYLLDEEIWADLVLQAEDGVDDAN